LIFVDKQKYDKALAQLSLIQRLFPTWEEIYKERGLCWRDKNMNKRAIQALRIAHRHAESPAYKLMLEAQICWIQDKPLEASKKINRAVELDGLCPKFLHFRAFIQSCLPLPEPQPRNAALSKSSLEKELADYNRVLEIHRTVAPYKRLQIVYNNMGYVEYERRNFDKALELYTKSLQLCPHHVRAFYNRCLVYQEMRMPEKAIADIDHILTINPSLYEVYSLRGWSNVSLGRYEDAAADYRKSLPRTAYMDHVVSAYIALLVCIGSMSEALTDVASIIADNERDVAEFTARQKTMSAEQQQEEGEFDAIDLSISDSDIPDYEVNERRVKDLTSTLNLAHRVVGELSYIEGQWVAARTALDALVAREKVQRELLEKDPTNPLAPSEAVLSNLADGIPFLRTLLTATWAPKWEKISPGALEFVKQGSRVCRSPNFSIYFEKLRVETMRFANMDEAAFFAASFGYKYLALYLPTSGPVTSSRDSLCEFLETLHKLPETSVAYYTCTFPYLLLLLFKYHRQSMGNQGPATLDNQFPKDTSALTIPASQFFDAMAQFLEDRISVDDQLDFDTDDSEDEDEDEDADEEDDASDDEDREPGDAAPQDGMDIQGPDNA
jgi:tetratricopeptide (TPR) repeat protein